MGKRKLSRRQKREKKKKETRRDQAEREQKIASMPDHPPEFAHLPDRRSMESTMQGLFGNMPGHKVSPVDQAQQIMYQANLSF